MDDRDTAALDSAKTQQIRLDAREDTDVTEILPARLLERLEVLAADTRRAVSELVVEAVEQYLDRRAGDE